MGNLSANTSELEKCHHCEGKRSLTSGLQGYLILAAVLGVFIVAIAELVQKL